MRLKDVPHNVSYRLVGEQMPFRTVMRDTRIFRGNKQVYIAPFNEGRLFKDRGRWIDWDTDVEIVAEIVEK